MLSNLSREQLNRLLHTRYYRFEEARLQLKYGLTDSGTTLFLIHNQMKRIEQELQRRQS